MRLPIIAIGLWAIGLYTATAQTVPGNIRFNRIDIESGLSHNQVNCIYKDETGFVWLGTQEGLNRYDGNAFTVFRRIAGKANSLADNMITGLYGGPCHTLWVTTATGIQVMDAASTRFYTQADSLLRSWHLPDKELVTIQSLTGNRYAFVFRPAIWLWKEGKPVHYSAWDATTASGVAEALTADREGMLWIAYRNGYLRRVNPASGNILLEKHLLATPVTSSITYGLYADSSMHLWIYRSGDNTGVQRLDCKTGDITVYSAGSTGRAISGNLITGVTENEGMIWIATDHGGVSIVQPQTGKVTVLYNREGDAHSISQNSIICMYKDNTGIVWLGTYKKGACYYKKGALPFSLQRYDPVTRSGLPFNDVNNFVEDRTGNIWIGTNGGGLLYYNRNTGSYQTYRNPNGPDGNVIVGMCYDHAGNLWTGTYMGGLDVYDGHAFRHFHHQQADTASLTDDRVFSVFESRQHQLWVGSMGGLDRYDAATGRFMHYGKILENLLFVSYVSCMAEDNTGNLWIGTPQGIAVYNPVSGAWRTITPENSGLVYRDVNDIYRDAEGNMWVATRGGVSVLMKNEQRFTSFGVKEGLPDEATLKVIGDQPHVVWISTVRGLARLALQQVNNKWRASVAAYQVQDGLQGTAFNKYSGYKTSRGELIFGGADGFNLFDPRNITGSEEVAPVVITALYGRDKKGTTFHFPSGTFAEGQLPYRQNNITVSFAALAYGSGIHSRYQYRLTGLQDKWIEPAGGLRTLTFSNLAPGTYTFEVRAASRNGIWSKQQATFIITVSPPFWLTGWAWLVYTLAFIGMLMASRSYLISRTKARMALAAERRDAERLRQLDEMKLKFFTNVSHELRTPLSLIISPLEQWQQHAGRSMQEGQVQMMHRNARRLLHLVNQLLDFRKMELSELHLHPQTANIIPFIESTVNSFLDLSVQKHIQLSFRTGIPEVNTAFDGDKLERILFNLLSNAFKFTPAEGEIEVLVLLQQQAAGSVLLVKVSDTGIGIAPDAQQQIFTPFYQEHLPAGMLNQGSGIGLSIAREFARLHGGDITLESRPGEGSCFTLQLPVAEIQSITETPPIQKEIVVPAVTDKPVAAETVTARKKQLPLILLVEDNEDFRFYLKDNLSRYYQVIVAENGREGWQKALSAHPAVIISDVSMPVMDGIELCGKLKEDKRTATIPVLLMTALTDEEYQCRGWKTGASGYLVKPFSVEVLLSRLQNLLEQQERLQKQLQKQVMVVPAQEPVANTADEKFVAHALSLVQQHMADPAFSVETLSRGLRMSRVAAYKRLYQLTGKAPLDFIRSVRLQHAAQLLEHSDKTVAEIAYEVGFNDPKYFSRFFKSVYQVTPSVYVHTHRKAGNQPPATGALNTRREG